MPVQITIDQKDPIITLKILPPFKPTSEFPEIHRQLDTMADKMERPIFRIYDLSKSKIDFSTLVEFLHRDTAPSAGSASDWRFKPMFVGHDRITQLAADSMGQEQYGGIETRIFNTMDAARIHARKELEKYRQKREQSAS